MFRVKKASCATAAGFPAVFLFISRIWYACVLTKGEGACRNAQRKNWETFAGHQCKTAAYFNRRACYFSQYGIHGARLEQVAERAGVSKTNLLYYYPSKEALYVAVMRQILDVWLAPLKAFRAEFSPLEAIKEYIRLKLEVSRDYPQASRLFCMEMLAGAPLLMDELSGDLKALIDEKSALIAGWVHSGKLAPVSPHHLIFMIWAATQHYADFAPQVEAVTGATLRDEAFFNQTVESVQRIIIEGIRVR